MKILRVCQTVVLAILCTIGTASVLVCAATFIFELRPAIVVSGSMEPTLPVGSVTFTQTVDASTVKVGDIVTVPQAGAEGVVTHRVAALSQTDDGRTELTLRGDANKMNDPVPYTVQTVQAYRFKVPYLGTALMWAKAHRLAACAILIGALGFMFIGRTRTTVRLPNGEVVKGLSKRDAERLVRAWHAQQDAMTPAAAAGSPEKVEPVAVPDVAASVSAGEPARQPAAKQPVPDAAAPVSARDTAVLPPVPSRISTATRAGQAAPAAKTTGPAAPAAAATRAGQATPAAPPAKVALAHPLPFIPRPAGAAAGRPSEAVARGLAGYARSERPATTGVAAGRRSGQMPGQRLMPPSLAKPSRV
ncbi:MAG: signal peptidase I [Bifidobacteriaceae bacterium]|jgi:signal peptidase|nr:signal peptidase I [Bifidobacteriaceae bacterium]